MKDILTTKQLCELLGVSKTTLWRYVKKGKLPQPKKLSSHVHLWQKSEICALIAKL